MLDAQCALLSLQSVPGIGARTLNRMLAWAKQTGSRISDVFALPERDLQQVFKLRAESVAALRQASP